MKKLFLIPLFCILFSLTCFAQAEYNYENEDTTVIFQTNSAFSDETKQYIADRLIYGKHDDDISTYAWCWLTGHDKQTETVYVIKHKLFPTEPRCEETEYSVTTCSKCDFYEEAEIASYYISCCPED
ncbi:MAG: hypothetical protein IJE40_00050 [Clostridia bacterium]|nr:hypothetical protein [Clostridia bacterium]